jgi:hypothetical protein
MTAPDQNAALIDAGAADGCRDRALSVRLREISASIRGALAAIRNTLDPPPADKRTTVRPRLILGDENRE